MERKENERVRIDARKPLYFNILFMNLIKVACVSN